MSKDNFYKFNITYPAGDFISLPFKFTENQSSGPLELLDRTVYFTIKNDKDDLDSQGINKQILVGSSTNSVALELQTAETINFEGEYLVSAIVSYPGDPNNRHITLMGKLNFIKTLRQTV